MLFIGYLQADAQILSLPKQLPCNEGDGMQPETGMQWQSSSKLQRKGKTIPESKPIKPLNNQTSTEGGELDVMSSLDIMEMCINEKTSKFTPIPQSVFFAPILDRCIFGITLLNAATT